MPVDTFGWEFPIINHSVDCGLFPVCSGVYYTVKVDRLIKSVMYVLVDSTGRPDLIYQQYGPRPGDLWYGDYFSNGPGTQYEKEWHGFTECVRTWRRLHP